MSKTAEKKGYNAYAVRRRVRRDFEAADGVHVFKSKSMTQPEDNSDRYHPAVDVRSGRVECNCGDFTYRHARCYPTVNTPEHCCKHIKRAVETLRRNGELKPVEVQESAYDWSEIFDS